MTYRHSYSGGLRWMDYDADDTTGGLTANSVRFPSDGLGGVTETFDGCDIDGYMPSVVMIQVITAASDNQSVKITDSAGTAITTQTIGVGEAVGEVYLPVMQHDAVIIGPNLATNTTNATLGMEVSGGFGFKVDSSAGNAVKLRVWYSVV